jgi:excisionase family DNA binding protein|tara:strand:+ start:360 stop:530 length:171 start_codon:yes stop_codon:yes gene_type:complete
MKNNKMITPKELGLLLGVTSHTVRRWAFAGKIPSYRIGNRAVRFIYEEVRQAMRSS